MICIIIAICGALALWLVLAICAAASAVTFPNHPARRSARSGTPIGTNRLQKVPATRSGAVAAGQLYARGRGAWRSDPAGLLRWHWAVAADLTRL